jgi:hypothetical protein
MGRSPTTDHGLRTTDSPDSFCRTLLAAAALLLLPLVPSCTSTPRQPTTRLATDIDQKQALPDYWLDRPAVASASDADFFKLWNACQTEVRLRLFLIERQDYRNGILTTQPLISQQFFEFWRHDVVNAEALASSSLSTLRRTVRVQVIRQPDGTFIAQPKVLVERYTDAERRLTAITEYHSAFTSPRPTEDTDVGAPAELPPEYWYVIGRDEALERDLAKSIQHRLRG